MAPLLVVAVAVAYGIGNVIWSISTWAPEDVDVYWDAALRLRNGEPLYPATGVDPSHAYRYAPWFAAAWVPLTFLPRTAVDVAWSGLLLAASAVTLIATLRAPSPARVALAFLVGSFLVVGAKFGNVQPLMVAALALGAGRRSGPLWIGLAASLKATPLLYVLVYVGRRQWRRAAITCGVAAVLVGPMLLMGITDYPTEPAWSHSLYTVSLPLFLVVAGLAVGVAAWVAWRLPRFAWLAVSVAVILTLPRYFQYELTYLLVGALAHRAGEPGNADTAHA